MVCVPTGIKGLSEDCMQCREVFICVSGHGYGTCKAGKCHGDGNMRQSKEVSMEEINPLIALDEQIREMTDDLCYLIPGPGGIGMVIPQQSHVYGFLVYEPEPVLNDVVFPEEIPKYVITVGVRSAETQKEMSTEELQEQILSSCYETAVMAGMLLKFKDIRMTVARESCSEAFGILADRIMKEVEAERMEQTGQSM